MVWQIQIKAEHVRNTIQREQTFKRDGGVVLNE